MKQLYLCMLLALPVASFSMMKKNSKLHQYNTTKRKPTILTQAECNTINKALASKFELSVYENDITLRPVKTTPTPNLGRFNGRCFLEFTERKDVTLFAQSAADQIISQIREGCIDSDCNQRILDSVGNKIDDLVDKGFDIQDPMIQQLEVAFEEFNSANNKKEYAQKAAVLVQTCFKLRPLLPQHYKNF